MQSRAHDISLRFTNKPNLGAEKSNVLFQPFSAEKHLLGLANQAAGYSLSLPHQILTLE
jgi:hypothetical protein